MRRKTRDFGRLKLIAFFVLVAVLLPKFINARSTDELGAFSAGETGIKLCARINNGYEDALRFSVTSDQGFASDVIVAKDTCKTIETQAANYTIREYLPQEYELISVSGGTVSEDATSFVATTNGQYAVIYENSYSSKPYLHNFGYTSITNSATAAEVEFEANGGKGSMQTQSYGINSQSALSANSFTRGGYTFAGWNTKRDGTGTSYTDGQQIAFAAGGELKLYAQWDYVERIANTVIAEQANAPFHVDFTKPAVISDDITTANGNGISAYTETAPDGNTGPVYYYRGVVDNNNVVFADFCWKIVRTTANGGTKLIYNGVPSVHDGIKYCDATGEDTSIGKSTMNQYNNSPTDAWYMYGTRYNARDEEDIQAAGTVFARSVVWNDTYHRYTLQSTYTVTNWADDYETIARNYRYTCGSSSTMCSSVRYMVQISKYSGLYDNFSITLSSGETSYDVAKARMLANENDSKAKKMIDDWYAVNMAGHISATDDTMAEGKIDYSNRLEQEVFCNDREVATGPLKQSNGLVGEYAAGASYIYSRYAGYERNRVAVDDSLTASGKNFTPSLGCANAERDLFSTASATYGNKALKYPVGMITTDETDMASFDGSRGNGSGMNYDSYLNSGDHLLVATPGTFYTTAGTSCSLGSCTGMANRTSTSALVRPVISLKELTTFHGGDGTIENPYIVE